MTPFLASMIYVLLRVTQQLNVVFNKKAWIFPVSYGMATCDVLLVGVISVSAVNSATTLEQAVLILQIGTGGGLGALIGMTFHKRVRK